MAHPEQQRFCLSVKEKYPNKFIGVNVLDVGSMDINGNNRWLFDEPFFYTGIDLQLGPNVHVAVPGHLYNPSWLFDVVISTECFEHDSYWKETIANCIALTKPGGVFLFSCATTGRPEHGTSSHSPADSPFTHSYYRNLDKDDVLSIQGFAESFSEFEFSNNQHTKDLYFYGIRK